MKNFGKLAFARKFISVSSLIALLFTSMMATSLPAFGAIEATDYFTLTVAGNATTMDAGGSLVFTINSKDTNGDANALAVGDFAIIDIWPLNWDSSDFDVSADVTAVGGGATLKASQASPWGGATTAANLDGTNDTLVAVNIDGTGAGTVTVTATESFGVCVGAQGAAINAPDTGDFGDSGALAGQDCREITVASGSGSADHLDLAVSNSTPEINEFVTITATQKNLGGGLDTGALADVMILLVDVFSDDGDDGEESFTFLASAEHGLSVGNIVKFTTGTAAAEDGGNANAYYIVSEVPTTTTFKVIGMGVNVFYGDPMQLTPYTPSDGVNNAMTATPGTIVADTTSTIGMAATDNMAATDGNNIVSIAGCTGYYMVTAISAGTSIDVIGPNACTPTGSGNVVKQSLAAGAEQAYTLSNASSYIYSVDGVPLGNTTTHSLTNQSLTDGVLQFTMTSTEAQTVSPFAISGSLAGEGSAPPAVVFGAATDLAIQGYSPMNGQTSVPVNAPIDFFVTKDPSTSLSFPLTNTTSSAFSITSGGTAVPGEWNYFSETWGASTFYGVTFRPTAPLSSSTSYTTSVLKSFAPSKGSTDLVDGSTEWNATFTTGTGGGTFVEGGGGFAGDMGGSFPPIAMMGYPGPGQWEVPTNIGCVTVDFDRPMTVSDLSTSNIYIQKVVNGALSDSLPSGTPVVTVIGDENDSVCISGYTFEASSEYCVVVDNDVTSTTGDSLAGMPGSSAEGCGGTFGGGFGFDNMGPFEESFHTGTGSKTVTASLMSLNLGNYGSTITGVSVGSIVRATFNAPLNPSTVNTTNVTLKKNGTIVVPGSVYYDSGKNAIEFVPTSALAASTSYTFAVSSSVTSTSGTAITAVSQAFTTGAADSTPPQFVFADADNYGVFMHFDEPLNKTTAENKSYYTIKTCSGQDINSDGVKCADNSTDPTAVSLLSGVNAHYERDENSVWMDGMTLTPGDAFYIAVSTSITDVAGNGFHAANNKSWTGTVMNAGNFDGGQGMFNMDTKGMDDFDMHDMGMKPVGAWPMNATGGLTTLYFLDIPVSTAIPADGYIELTFPTGFGVTGAIRDPYSPMNSDFNGPMTGSPTFADNDTTSVSTDTAGVADDGIGYIAAARKVYIQLDSATQANDFLHIDISGITNATEARDFGTSGYQVKIKTYDDDDNLLEAMTTMPFFITAGGTNTISGQITSGGSGVNGVRVFLDSWAAGFQETTTANNAASGGQDGEYLFSNLPDGDYHIFIEPSDGYSGKDFNLGYITSNTTKNVALTALNGTNCATIPITVNIANIGNISSLGFNDSIDIFGWNTTGQGGFVKTVARASLPGPVNVFACNVGLYNIGIGPALPKGEFASFPQMNWIPPQNQNVNVTSDNIGGAAMTGKTFATSAPNATITGIVKDSAGVVVTSGKVFADFPAGGFAGDAKIASDGTFSIPVSRGKVYRVGAFAPGMPPGADHSVKIDSSGNVYVDGSPTASTGSSGLNPFTLTMSFVAANSVTVSGRVSDGSTAIAGAGVWAFRTDAPSPPVDGFTDDSGNYILYIPSAGTWQLEANAPGKGHLGTKTLTVTTENFTEQNFEPLEADLMGSIAGTVDVPGTADDSGAVVWAFNPDGFFNEAVTESDGTYTFDVPIDADAYTVEVWHPDTGNLAKVSQVVDGAETVSPAALGTPRSFTITLTEAVSDDVHLDLKSSTGMGSGIVIPAGETVITTSLPQGNYYLDLYTPFDEDTVTVSGAEINLVDGTPSTDDQLDIDGTGDNITLTMPTLHTVAGNVGDGSAGIEDAVVTIIDESTNDTFTVLADSNGDYTFEAPTGTYSVLAEQSGYVATPQSLTVSTDLPSQDFTLDAADKTISGTITDSGGDPVEGALVYAQMAGGGSATTETAADGTYTMNVSAGQWDVTAVTDGFSESTAVSANTSSVNVSSLNVALPATTVSLDNPATKPVTASSPTSFSDEDMGLSFVLPKDSVDANATMSFTETNELPATTSAIPFSKGVDIEGSTTNDSSPITSFDNPAKIAFEYTIAEMTTEGIDTPAEVNQVTIAYLNENTNNWTPGATNVTYYDSSDAVIPKATIAGYDTLAAAAAGADLTTVKLSTTSNHLTTFAPIVTSGATPPATPTGLAATAADGNVILSWTANTEGDMSYYNIWEANVTEGSAGTYLHSSCTTTCSVVMSGLTNGTAYAYQLLAVDTDGNSSAGSSAVSVTPVAASSSSNDQGIVGGGGGGGGGASSSSDSVAETGTEAVELEVSTVSENVAEVVEVGEEGVVEAEVSVQAAGSEAAVTISAETTVTDSEGNPYVGAIAPPAVVTISVDPVEGKIYVGSVYEVGSSEMTLNFSQPISLRLPLPSNINASDDVSVYYLDEENGEWVLAGDGGEIMEDEDGDLVAVVEIDHLTKFAVMEDEVTVSEILAGVPFEDIFDHWAKSYIEALYLAGVVNGYDETHYGPDNTITRAEITKIAVNVNDIELPGLINPAMFDDLDGTEWYAPFVQAAYDADVVSGYEDGTFKPNKAVSRAEAVSILLEAAGIDVETDYDAGFPDVSGSAWYADHVNYAAENGIVSGYLDGTFGPGKNLTRGEVAKIVVEMMKDPNIYDEVSGEDVMSAIKMMLL